VCCLSVKWLRLDCIASKRDCKTTSVDIVPNTLKVCVLPNCLDWRLSGLVLAGLLSCNHYQCPAYVAECNHGQPDITVALTVTPPASVSKGTHMTSHFHATRLDHCCCCCCCNIGFGGAWCTSSPMSSKTMRYTPLMSTSELSSKA
jgi:hypothetical protein